MTGRLIHTGQVILDLVMRVKGLPPVGGDVFASHTDLQPGGGFNVMAAAARAGAEVVYAGGHGDGRFGDLARAALAAEGITAALPPAPGADTGICVVLVDGTGERTFVTGSGAESSVDAAALAAVPVTAADVVYVSGYSLLVPDKAAVLLDRLENLDGPTVLVDPGPLVGEIDIAAWSRLLERTSILSTNAREARILTGETDRWDASAKLARRVPASAAVIVRDGAAGCLVTRDGTTTHVPGIPVEAVDTTGAGDAHCGVLAAELLRGTDLAAAATRANAAAALAVTRPGPATAPTRAEVDLLLATTTS
ncbi:bifunctional hydroxymethylpyrimidine kinase/phosphomethylpyrimidine kinase [Pseudonocardia sp. DSM 110487]|uniref:PfkB family carbohydrate kinase n=1 Tax=Pseudonocardia sp. DSM 110487 TaxID=2865833 RepID=UPI001C6A633D|nr:PfkB family carbohydrate kinase [Pseudonocardia sp. DSM 110487]QYN35241.1 bifunctional hydroxymethylpyrimidine kinase/phosphomethylpyrimidine kinase [Pseudonocardia sp. DSM 110487]